MSAVVDQLSRRSAVSDRLASLRRTAPAVLPSLLLCDFGNLEREIRRLEDAGVKGLHLDVMDGHFVPNLTYGMPLVEAVRRLTSLPIDAHLMISQPAKYVRQFAEAGADMLTVHAEAEGAPRDLIEQIHGLGCGAGLAINPPTPLAVKDCLELCQLVLVMSVMPGFGGQTFDERALVKLGDLRDRALPGLLLEVDGGVNEQTIERCADSGANLFVVGSAIFNQDNYQAQVAKLERLATSMPRSG